MQAAKMKSRQAGFSLVELIIVITLVGIVAVVAMSRMLGPNTFNAPIVRDAILSMARSAQQNAIGHTDIVMTLDVVGNELQLMLEAGTTLLSSAMAPMQDVTIRADVNETDSCAVTQGETLLGPGSSLVVEYDALGSLLQGGPVNGAGYPYEPTAGMRLCINGEVINSICISPAGYAYAGDCDE
jgi:MSHA pilin protein MshC